MSERLQGDNARFYKILNVSNTVSEYDLKKAYSYAYMTFRGINREKVSYNISPNIHLYIHSSLSASNQIKSNGCIMGDICGSLFME